jgi:hypothetical protein
MIVLLFRILHTSASHSRTHESFTTVNTTDASDASVFGNLVLSNVSNTNAANQYKLTLTNGLCRVESLIITAKGFAGNAKCTISYNNEGTTFSCASFSITSSVKNFVHELVNTNNRKVYATELLLTFDVTITDLVVFVYAMKLGDYDKNYYINSSNNTYSANTNAANNPKLPYSDITNSNKRNHYFHISNRQGDSSPNKLIKSLTYKITTATGTTPSIITLNYKNTSSNPTADSADVENSTIYSVTDKTSQLQQFYYTPVGGAIGTLYFSIPILANIIIIQTNNQNTTFTTADMEAHGTEPDNVDVQTYAVPAYIKNKISPATCPAASDIIKNNNITAALCEQLETTDKLQFEKARLAKEKQYFIKLKKQNDDINRLQEEITKIESTRTTRDKLLDNLRLQQFQQQREEAVALRDATTEQLSRQRTLNLDVNIQDSL